MKLHHITPHGTYQISGADLLGIINFAVELAWNKRQPKEAPPVPDKWAGKHKLTTEEAVEYLNIKKATLYSFHKKYKMEYERSRPNQYNIEELQRVERIRRVRPH